MNLPPIGDEWETTAVVVGVVVSALLGIAALLRGDDSDKRPRPIESEPLKLQQPDADRTKQEQLEEPLRMEHATLDVSLRQEPRGTSRSGRPWHFLDITNNGPAVAYDVVLRRVTPKLPGVDTPGFLRDEFPIREIGPGKSFPCRVNIIGGDTFEAEVAWRDSHGSYSKVFAVSR